MHVSTRVHEEEERGERMPEVGFFLPPSPGAGSQILQGPPSVSSRSLNQDFHGIVRRECLSRYSSVVAPITFLFMCLIVAVPLMKYLSSQSLTGENRMGLMSGPPFLISEAFVFCLARVALSADTKLLKMTALGVLRLRILLFTLAVVFMNPSFLEKAALTQADSLGAIELDLGETAGLLINYYAIAPDRTFVSVLVASWWTCHLGVEVFVGTAHAAHRIVHYSTIGLLLVLIANSWNEWLSHSHERYWEAQNSANKVEMLNRRQKAFLLKLSHELRTPVTSLKFCCTSLLAQLSPFNASPPPGTPTQKPDRLGSQAEVLTPTNTNGKHIRSPPPSSPPRTPPQDPRSTQLIPSPVPSHSASFHAPLSHRERHRDDSCSPPLSPKMTTSKIPPDGARRTSQVDSQAPHSAADALPIPQLIYDVTICSAAATNILQVTNNLLEVSQMVVVPTDREAPSAEKGFQHNRSSSTKCSSNDPFGFESDTASPRVPEADDSPIENRRGDDFLSGYAVVSKPRWCSLKSLFIPAEELSVPLMEAKRNSFLTNLSTVPCLSVYADETRLQSVLLNLLSNASRFTVNGHVETKVVVHETSIETEEKDQKSLVRLPEEPGNPPPLWMHAAGEEEKGEAAGPQWKKRLILIRMQVSVKDTGCGIDPVCLPTIMCGESPSDTRTETGGGGSALGLRLCKLVLNAMGGSLSVHSEGEGKGTEVKFQVCLYAVRSGTSEEGPEKEAEGQGGEEQQGKTAEAEAAEGAHSERHVSSFESHQPSSSLDLPRDHQMGEVAGQDGARIDITPSSPSRATVQSRLRPSLLSVVDEMSEWPAVSKTESDRGESCISPAATVSVGLPDFISVRRKQPHSHLTSSITRTSPGIMDNIPAASCLTTTAASGTELRRRSTRSSSKAATLAGNPLQPSLPSPSGLHSLSSIPSHLLQLAGSNGVQRLCSLAARYETVRSSVSIIIVEDDFFMRTIVERLIRSLANESVNRSNRKGQGGGEGGGSETGSTKEEAANVPVDRCIIKTYEDGRNVVGTLVVSPSSEPASPGRRKPVSKHLCFLLTDMEMPNVSGLTLGRLLKKQEECSVDGVETHQPGELKLLRVGVQKDQQGMQTPNRQEEGAHSSDQKFCCPSAEEAGKDVEGEKGQVDTVKVGSPSTASFRTFHTNSSSEEKILIYPVLYSAQSRKAFIQDLGRPRPMSVRRGGGGDAAAAAAWRPLHT
uniref:histidine kinase n=1 Tax=Chromera velia CCMP2878 TaxID=1169474 RepID=A0A0G4G2P3_9ALVE|eukprot:Cvel_19971.t1-p1 / transcript=Cvel_19971.t1 / gene=Cvel_19971 / organism=Chromera_velia_CCMP2878 / gene_product=Ethylene receptor 1, putative / transcript_product=Ethylene receptor 1, putative / location=Cvel_scaffold1758:26337-35396(-) / protein_length=1213 / sequence_SO=supercontig / SO=protein_coding / is_pseudo=false